jgi:subtilase family serine protease
MKNFIKLSIIIALSLGIFSFKSSNITQVGLPDLIVKSITPSIVGGNLRLKIKIKNVGNGNAVGNFKNYIELNNIHEPSPNPHRIKNRLINGLLAGQTKTIFVTYLHAHVLPTDTKVTVVTDSKIEQIIESNEGNNSLPVAIPSL